MKVLMVTTYFPQTSETFILDHAVSLVKKGISTQIISLFEAPKSIVHEDFSNYQLQKLVVNERPSNISKLSSFLLQVKQLIYAFFSSPIACIRLLADHQIMQKRTYFAAFRLKKMYQNADIIHAHFGNVGQRIIHLKRIGIVPTHTPVVCSFHGSDIDEPYYRERPNFYQTFFKSVDLVISNSNYLTNRLKENKCPIVKIEKVSNGVNLDKFSAADRIAKSSSAVFKFITTARLTEVKGISYSIEAMKLLRDQGIQNFEYIIIGDGELKTTLQQLIQSLGLSQHVQLLGMKTQMQLQAYYQEADVFILPSITTTKGRVETQGVALLEAQAMGLPVIATKVGGLQEGVVDGVTGFLVDEKSAAAIADKLELILTAPDRYLSMGKAGIEHMKANYDADQQIEKIVHHYQRLLLSARKAPL